MSKSIECSVRLFFSELSIFYSASRLGLAGHLIGFVIVASVLYAMIQPAQSQVLDPRCSDRTVTGRIVCRIDQPNVTQHETVYPNIVFAPGDLVEIQADGCVQTGGSGDTWKRYVNPSGDNSDQLYHGLVRIPTATANSALVRVNSVVGRLLKVTGVGVPASNLVLHLGYEDDGYGDNGYYSHDDGNDNQCKSRR